MRILRSNYFKSRLNGLHALNWRNNPELTDFKSAKHTYGLQSVPEKTDPPTTASTSQSGARGTENAQTQEIIYNTFSTCECEYCEVTIQVAVEWPTCTKLTQQLWTDSLRACQTHLLSAIRSRKDRPTNDRINATVRGARNRKRTNTRNNITHSPRVNVSTVK